jgi:hypothetical protein
MSRDAALNKARMRSSLDRVKGYLLDDTLKGVVIIAFTGGKDFDWAAAHVDPHSDPDGNAEIHIIGSVPGDPAELLQQFSDDAEAHIHGGFFTRIIRKWRRRLFVH